MRGSKLVEASVVFMALVVLAIVLRTFQGFFRPLVIAVVLTLLMMPIVRYLKKMRVPAFATVMGVVAGTVLLLAIVGFFLSGDGADMEDALPNYEMKVKEGSRNYLELTSRISLGGKRLDLRQIMGPERASQLVVGGIKRAMDVARTIFIEAIFALVFMLFLMPSYASMTKGLGKKHGAKKAKKIRSMIFRIEGDIWLYFAVKTAMSLGTAVASTFVLFLFNAQFIFISALIIFGLNYIPTIGSIAAVVVITGLYVLTYGLTMNALWLFLVLFLVQILFGGYLEPMIAGRRLSISPIVIILSLSIWGWIFGLIGMLLAVPLTVMIKIILKNIKPTKGMADLLG